MSEPALCCPACGQTLPNPAVITPNTLTCELPSCGSKFVPNDHKQRFCTPACRLRAHRKAKQAPRVLSPEERKAVVDAAILAGKVPREVHSIERTAPMFSEPSAGGRRGKTTKTPRQNVSLSDASSSSEVSSRSSTGGNADETQVWVRMVVDGVAHTMRKHPPPDGTCLAVCGEPLEFGTKDLDSVPACRKCKPVRDTGEVLGLKKEELDLLQMTLFVWAEWKEIANGKVSYVDDVHHYFASRFPWKALDDGKLWLLAADALAYLASRGVISHSDNMFFLRKPYSPKARKTYGIFA